MTVCFQNSWADIIIIKIILLPYYSFHAPSSTLHAPRQSITPAARPHDGPHGVAHRGEPQSPRPP